MKFVWNPNLYDQKHGYVSEFGIDIVKLLDPREDQVILDLVCGTGDLTKMISECCREVVGVDNSPDMIKNAGIKYPSSEFIEGDVRDLYLNRMFDAVFSNAMLHWVPEAETAIRTINRHLKPGGRFVAEFGGKVCIHKIIHMILNLLDEKQIVSPDIGDVLFYPSVGEYSALLEKNGIEVTYAALFDRPTELKGGYEGLNSFIEMFLNWMIAEADPKEKRKLLPRLENVLKVKCLSIIHGLRIIEDCG